MATTDKVSNSAAAAAEARERAIEEAKARAEAEARQRAAEEAARQRAAQAAAAQKAREQQAQKAKAPTKTFKTDDLSTGKGGALRRAAASKLSAQGLDPAQPSTDTGKTLKAKDLLNGQALTADPKKDAASLAKITDPGQRAQAFQKLIEKNKDDAKYQQQLITQSKASIEDLATKAVNKDSGASQQSRQSAIDAMAKATESLKPDAQKQLADTFAGTMKNQNVGDDSDEFGTMMKNAVKDGSGASFGVRLASSLQSSNKTTAANDLSKFVGQGINDVKSDFEDAQKKVDELHGRLGQELATWKLEGKDQTTALKQFDEDNGLSAATKDLESKGALLASTLDGAHLASTDPALQAGAAAKNVAATRFGSYSTAKYSNESDLLGAAGGALGDVGKLADTKAGAEKITDAVEKSGEGEATFLDGLAEKTEKGEDGVKVVNKLRSAVVQSLGAKLLDSAASGTFDADKSKILAGLKANSALFGASSKQMGELTDSLNQFKPGMTAAELDQATKTTADKIGELGEGDGAVAQSLKGLSVVFGTVGAVKDWSHFSEADVKEKLATISNTLTVGQEGADLITSTFSRFAANSAAKAGEEGSALAETAGLTAGKLLGAGIGALGAVVSGWQAFDAFKDGKYVEGAGDTMMAVGGAVATAGLFLDGTIAGAPAGVVLNVVGGVLAAGGAIVGLFGGKDNPFEGQEEDLDHVFKALGVNQDVADQLKDFNSDGQNFGTWVSTVAGQMKMSTGDFVRSMNGWSPQQVTDFLDAARLQHDTDSNNDHRLENATSVLGSANAQALEDPSAAPYYGRYGYITPDVQKKLDAQKAAQAALRERVDEKTGQITYDQSLVDATVAWLQAGRPAKN